MYREFYTRHKYIYNLFYRLTIIVSELTIQKFVHLLMGEKMEDNICSLIGLSNRMIRHSIEKYLKQYGITAPQWGVLNLLYEDKNLSQVQIAQRNHADKVTVGNIIDKLVERELVVRRISENDKRIYEISLTDKGDKLVQEVRPFADANNNKTIECLNNEEQTNLKEYLNRIILHQEKNKENN